MSCAEGDSPSCPTPVKISIGEELEEGNRVLKITITPALTLNQPNPTQVTAELLVQKHLKFTVKKKEQEAWSAFEVESQAIEHSTTSSELSIRFKEAVKISEVSWLKVEVNDPWVYKTDVGVSPQKAIYFKKKTYEIEANEGKEQLKAFSAAKALGAVLSGTAAGALVGGLGLQALKLADYISVYMFFKYMNFIDIVLAITKVNVELEPRVKIIVEFLEGLKMPKIGFIARNSPIRHTEAEKKGQKPI